MKKVIVLCPSCKKKITFKNYLSYIFHTPFHWFGKRRMKCPICGKKSYVTRVKED